MWDVGRMWFLFCFVLFKKKQDFVPSKPGSWARTALPTAPLFLTLGLGLEETPTISDSRIALPWPPMAGVPCFFFSRPHLKPRGATPWCHTPACNACSGNGAQYPRIREFAYSRTTAQETERLFAMALPPGTVDVGSCGIALNSTTRRHPRLGLVSGSRGPTQIHIRGLCHWATGPVSMPVSRRATSAPSHRADEPPGPQAPEKQQARLVRTGPEDFPRRTT